MTPELEAMLNQILSAEEHLRHMELKEMNMSHMAGLMGLKRMHRYYAMDRERHVIKLQNFMVDCLKLEPSYAVAVGMGHPVYSLTDSLKMMYDKGMAHIETLEAAEKKAYEEGECLLGDYLGYMVKDQAREMAKYNKVCMDFRRENADHTYLSNELHRKFKCKEAKKFNYKGDVYA